MVVKLIAMFCSITLVLSTQQEDERLAWAQLNITYKVVGKHFLKIEKVYFVACKHKQATPQI